MDKIDSRYYDPQLIWSFARQAALAELERIGHHPATMTQVDPRIYIYVDGMSGALLVQMGRLFHDDDLRDQYIGRTDDTILDHADAIREVVVRFGRDSRAFLNYDDFVAWVTSKNDTRNSLK